MDQASVVDQFGRSVSLGGPLSFCYIDGLHTYDQCSRDFQNVDRWLQVGGFVLFDDSSDFSDWEGVRRVVSEVRRGGRYRVVLNNPNYLFKKLR